MPNRTNPVPEDVFKKFNNEIDISFSITNFNVGANIIAHTLTKDSYDIPDGYNSNVAPFHTKKIDGVEIFDIALGFRSSSLTKTNPPQFPTSPYANGIYSTISGSGETNSSPSYSGEYLVTSSRIYDYISGKLNNHKDFVFSNSIVDTLAIISFKNIQFNVLSFHNFCKMYQNWLMLNFLIKLNKLKGVEVNC